MRSVAAGHGVSLTDSRQAVEGEVQLEHVDAARRGSRASGRRCARRRARAPSPSGRPRAVGDARRLEPGVGDARCRGSRPDPDAVTASTGTGASAARPFSLPVGGDPRSSTVVEQRRVRRARGSSAAARSSAVVAVARPPTAAAGSTSRGSVNALADQLRADDLAVRASRASRWPCRRSATCAMPVIDERVDEPEQHGERRPSSMMAGSELAAHHFTPSAVTTRSMSLMPMNGAMTPPSAVDQEVAAQHRGRAESARNFTPRSASGISTTMIERVEDDRREDRRVRAVEVHDVEACRAPGTRRRTSPG